MDSYSITIDSSIPAAPSLSLSKKTDDYHSGREDVSHLFQNQSSPTESSPSCNDTFIPYGNLDLYSLFEQGVSKSCLDNNPSWYNDNDFNENDFLLAPTDCFQQGNLDDPLLVWPATTEQFPTTLNDSQHYLETPISQTQDRPVLELITTSMPRQDQIPTQFFSDSASFSEGTTTASTLTTFKSESPAPESLSPNSKKPRERTRRQRTTRQQEEAVLDKQRERNRLAAGRCRGRQIERSQKLTDKADNLEKNRAELHFTVALLKAQVLGLKEELLRHNNCGCDQIRDYLQWRVEKLLEQPRRTYEMQPTPTETPMELMNMALEMDVA